MVEPAFAVEGRTFASKSDLTDSYIVLTKADGDSVCLGSTVYGGSSGGAASPGINKLAMLVENTSNVLHPTENIGDFMIETELAPNQAVNYVFPMPDGAVPKSAIVDLRTIRTNSETLSGSETWQRLVFRVTRNSGTQVSQLTRSLSRTIVSTTHNWDSVADINNSGIHVEAPDSSVILGLAQSVDQDFVTQSTARDNENTNCLFGTGNTVWREHATVVSATMNSQLFRLSFYRIYEGGVTGYANRYRNSPPNYTLDQNLAPLHHTHLHGNIILTWT